MASINFQHPVIGSLTIDTGLDQANWSYAVNYVNYPTYGGEVVQILSVYIDDLTLGGTVTTYAQVEEIYSYFASYFQVATQGKNPAPTSGNSVTGNSYNLQPVSFYYPERHWAFKLYPMSAPGFSYDYDVMAPTWQLTAHIIDDSPDLTLIKNGIQALAVSQLVNNDGGAQANTFNLTGNISPEYGDPNADPFETYNQGKAALSAQVGKYADYYNSLLPAYSSGEFGSLTGVVASGPNLVGPTQGSSGGSSTTATTQSGSTTGKGGAQAVAG